MSHAEEEPQDEVGPQERVLRSGDARRASAPERVPGGKLVIPEQRRAVGLFPGVELVVVHPVGDLERVAQDPLVGERGDDHPQDEAQRRQRHDAVRPANRRLSRHRLTTRS